MLTNFVCVTKLFTFTLRNIDMSLNGVTAAGTTLDFTDSRKLLCGTLDSALYLDRHTYEIADVVTSLPHPG